MTNEKARETILYTTERSTNSISLFLSWNILLIECVYHNFVSILSVVLYRNNTVN